jgi:hypothetical protein
MSIMIIMIIMTIMIIMIEDLERVLVCGLADEIYLLKSFNTETNSCYMATWLHGYMTHRSEKTETYEKNQSQMMQLHSP